MQKVINEAAEAYARSGVLTTLVIFPALNLFSGRQRDDLTF